MRRGEDRKDEERGGGMIEREREISTSWRKWTRMDFLSVVLSTQRRQGSLVPGNGIPL